MAARGSNVMCGIHLLITSVSVPVRVTASIRNTFRHLLHHQIESTTTYEAPYKACTPKVQRCEYDARIGLRGSRSSRLCVLCLGGTVCSFFLSSSDSEAISTV